MFCNNCKEEYNDDAKFCPICGQLLTNQQVDKEANYYASMNPQVSFEMPVMQSMLPNKQAKRKGILIISSVAALIAVVVIAVLVITSSIAKKPENMVRKSIDATIDQFKNNKVTNYISQVLNGGSIEINIDDENNFDIDGDIKAKLYSNLKNKKAQLVTDVDVDRIAFGAELYISEDEIIVSSDDIFGSNAYGVNLKNISKYVDDSPLRQYARQMERYKQSLNNTENENLKKISSEAKEVWNSFLDTFINNATFTKEEDERSILKEDISGYTITMNYGVEELKNVATTFLNEVKKDKYDELCGLIMSAFQSNRYGINSINDISELIGEMAAIDEETKQNYIEYIHDRIDEILEELDKLSEEKWAEDIDVKLEFFIDSETNHIAALDIVIDDGNEKMKGSFKLNEQGSFKVSLTMDGDTTSIAYTVKEEDDSINATFVYKDEWKEGSLEFTWDKEEGDASITMTDDYGNEYKVNGSMFVKKKNEVIFTVENVLDGIFQKDIGINVILKPEDKMPEKIKKYQDIFALGQSDLEEVIFDIGSNLQGMGLNFWFLDDLFDHGVKDESYN